MRTTSDDDDLLIQQILATCAVAAAATQLYVLKDQLQLDFSAPPPTSPEQVKAMLAERIEKSCDVSVKGTFAHRAVNAKDLVTQADMAVQKGVTHLLALWWKCRLSSTPTSSLTTTTTSTLLFEVIGEEDLGDELDGPHDKPGNAKDEVLEAVEGHASDILKRATEIVRAWPANETTTTTNAEGEGAVKSRGMKNVDLCDCFVSLLAHFTQKHRTNALAFLSYLQSKLEAHHSPHQQPTAARSSISSFSSFVGSSPSTRAEEKKKNIAIFIDPIDGTNSFVQGEPDVPMQLIGITHNEVPVAGVVNRVFFPVVHPETPALSLSMGWSPLTSSPSSASSFLLINGEEIALSSLQSGALQKQTTLAKSIDVTYSSSTKEAIVAPWTAWLQQQSHVCPVKASGAGHKIMLVVQGSVAALQEKQQQQQQVKSCAEGFAKADVFLSPIASLKAWDTVAPHAILRVLGGEIVHLPRDVPETSKTKFQVVRYPVFYTTADTSAATTAQNHHRVVDKKRSTTFPGGIAAVTCEAGALFGLPSAALSSSKL